MYHMSKTKDGKTIKKMEKNQEQQVKTEKLKQ